MSTRRVRVTLKERPNRLWNSEILVYDTADPGNVHGTRQEFKSWAEFADAQSTARDALLVESVRDSYAAKRAGEIQRLIRAALKARNRAAMTTRKRHVATERW